MVCVSDALEIGAQKSDTYHELLKRAVSALNMKKSINDLALYKMNGVEIFPDNDDEPWTLGRYLKKLKKASTSLRIGVGVKEREMVSGCIGLYTANVTNKRVCLLFSTRTNMGGKM